MICGNCKRDAQSIATVKACYAGELVPCGDLVSMGYDECGTLITAECGAHCTITERGWFCENGHEYINMETRWHERIEYASSEAEAQALAGMGISTILLDGPPIQLW